MDNNNSINKRSKSLPKLRIEITKNENEKVFKAQNNDTATTANIKSKMINKSRYSSLLKALGDEVKKKKIDKENAKILEEKKAEKLKTSLGLNKIRPKIIGKINPINQTFDIKLTNMISNRPNSTRDNELLKKNPKLSKIIIEDKKKIKTIPENGEEEIIEKAKTSSKLVEKQKRIISELEKKNRVKRKETGVVKNNQDLNKNFETEENEEFCGETISKPFKSIFKQNCSSFEDWKKKNRIDKDQKVFICSKEYPDIKKALINRGWLENDDMKSLFFDLKWSLKSSDLEHGKLSKNQIVNRFEKTGNLTRKSGLCKSLRNLVWFRNVNVESFYPKCYDLSETTDFYDFIEEFKTVKAESILKEFINKDIKFSIEQLNVCVKIIERKIKDINDIIDENENDNNLISENEWSIISNEEEIHDIENIKKNLHIKNSNKDENLQDKKKKTKPKSLKNLVKDGFVDNIIELRDKVKILSKRLEQKSPQFNINGSKNIWIVKPVGLSRGRGIQCISSFQEYLGFLKIHGNQYVIQKYIENPLIVFGRKFDIRQWVLVTDWNPLTIWIFDTPYLRLGAEDYSLGNLNNLYVHLTNNSIAKNSKNFHNTKFEGNMLSCEDFKSFLNEKYNRDVWNETLKERINQLVIWSLESAQDVIENRKNSHEIFGFDIMIDENLNPWLIEINSSPCMEYSTKITERLVQIVMEDTIKVTVDYNLAPKHQREVVDTGFWKLIHKGELAEANGCMGLNLVCKGTKIKAEPDM